MSLPISSVIDTVPVSREVLPVDNIHPGMYFFGTVSEALAWRSTLKDEEEQFLYRLDLYIARMRPGMSIDIERILKEGTPELFYRSLSYTLSFSGMINCFSWSDDYRVITKLAEYSTA
jgi:hypothetical protein